MPDTRRSQADLITLFADNSSGNISAGDGRDLILSAYNAQGICRARLTTESGVPVSTSDRTAQSTIYLTPSGGNLIGRFDGTSWTLDVLAELSLALSGLTSGKNYDVFYYDAAGTKRIDLGPAWSSDTARGTGAGTTELVLQDGVYVNAVSITGPVHADTIAAKAGLYVGTIRTTGTTTTEDSGGGTTTQVGGKRFVWNAYNRVPRRLLVIDTTDSWTYGTATWRAGDNASGNKVEYVVGLQVEPVEATTRVDCYSAGGGSDATVGVGVDSTTVNSATIHSGIYSAPGSAGPAIADYSGYPGIGYHYLQWIEYVSAGTVTYLGDNGGTGRQSGLAGRVWA